MKASPVFSYLLCGLDDLYTAHIGHQRLRDHHGAVLLLVVLQDGSHGAAHSQAGAVQGVDELGLGLGIPAELDVGTARLIVKAVGAGRNLTILALTGNHTSRS